MSLIIFLRKRHVLFLAYSKRCLLLLKQSQLSNGSRWSCVKSLTTRLCLYTVRNTFIALSNYMMDVQSCNQCLCPHLAWKDPGVFSPLRLDSINYHGATNKPRNFSGIENDSNESLFNGYLMINSWPVCAAAWTNCFYFCRINSGTENKLKLSSLCLKAERSVATQ